MARTFHLNNRPTMVRRLIEYTIFAKQKLSRDGPGYITCSGIHDGIGAQVHARLSTLLYAQAMGLRYVHSPFASIAHRPPGAVQWEEQCEQFFGLGVGELSLAEVQPRMRAVRTVSEATQVRKERDTLYVVPHCHTFANLFPNRYAMLRKPFRQKYWRMSKEPWKPDYAPDVINIAAHIRRGDVTATCGRKQLFTPNAYFANMVGKISAEIRRTGRPYAVHVFSEGDVADFQELRELGVTFHLNEDVFRTFHSLVLSDVLVLSKSCFSYIAALLSQGIKIYEPTGHRPLRDWLVVNVQGEICPRDFAAALARLPQGTTS